MDCDHGHLSFAQMTACKLLLFTRVLGTRIPHGLTFTILKKLKQSHMLGHHDDTLTTSTKEQKKIY